MNSGRSKEQHRLQINNFLRNFFLILRFLVEFTLIRNLQQGNYGLAKKLASSQLSFFESPPPSSLASASEEGI